MHKSYIPTREPELLQFSANLASKLSADPTAYGETADSIADFVNAQADFATKYATAIDPATRTSTNIAAKNTAKKTMIGYTRKLVQTLQNWPGMTNAKRDELDIPLRDQEPTKIGPPTELPVLRVAAVYSRVFNLELRRETDNTKRKPVGTKGATLYYFVGDQPHADLAQWTMAGQTGKHNPQVIVPDSVAPDTSVWFTANWFSPTFEPGPACAPVQSYTNRVGLSQAA
ncbi:MAG: hypothetical protein AAF797_14005 [Planctomycetota bacterium]